MAFTDSLKALGAVVASSAPLLGSVVMGPLGAGIGAIIANSFGVDPKNTDELIQKIQTDPQAAIKLKELEINSTIELQRLSVQQAVSELQNQQENARIALEDRASARNYASAQKSPETEKLDNRIKMLLTISSILLIFLCMAAIIMHRVEGEEQTIIAMILTFAVKSQSTKEDFYWGAAYEKMKSKLLGEKN